MQATAGSQPSITDDAPKRQESILGVSGRVAIAAAAGLIATWTAAGSIGVWADPLRRAIVWISLLVALVSLWPRGRQAQTKWWPLAVLAAICVWGVAAPWPMVNVSAVALALLSLAWANAGLDGRSLAIVGAGTLGLALFQTAEAAIPCVWHAADALGQSLGQWAARVTGRPLWIGASFGGVDYLATMAVVWILWIAATSRPRWARAVLAAVGIAAAHAAYLTLLSYAADWADQIPAAPPAPQAVRPPTPLWHWGESVRTLLPWGLPAAAAVLHSLIAVAMFRWAAWISVPEPAESGPRRERWVRHFGKWQKVADEPTAEGAPDPAEPLRRWRSARAVLAVIATSLFGLAIPLAAKFFWIDGMLQNKTIVLYDSGNVDWSTPEHGHLGQASAGKFGMLSRFIQSLGGTAVVKRELSEMTLKNADLVLLLDCPPLSADQIGALRSHCQGGKSVLAAGGAAANFVVRNDRAVSPVGLWRPVLAESGYPASIYWTDCRDELSLQGGSSIDGEADWSDRPILAARWAWSEPGHAPPKPYRYEPGEKLGDLILAAESPWEGGRVAVLGDASCLTNQALPASYPFTGRLLAALAQCGDSSGWPWRQSLTVLAMLSLIALLAFRSHAPRALAAAAAMAVGFAATDWTGQSLSDVVPDARDQKPSPIAYVDASHLPLHMGLDWGPAGVNGLTLALMRSGFMPFLMPEFSEARLRHAGLLIVTACSREYSELERKAIKGFVERGGVLICTVGAENAEPARSLLDVFDFEVSPTPPPVDAAEPETMPFGYCVQSYSPNPKALVCFRSAWEVKCRRENATVRARNPEGLPTIVTRPVGQGVVTVIGDSRFAWNVNLENDEGVTDEPTAQGQRYNPAFWRWFLTVVTGKPEWIPPDSIVEPVPAEKATAEKPTAEKPPAEKPEAKTPAIDKSPEESSLPKMVPFPDLKPSERTAPKGPASPEADATRPGEPSEPTLVRAALFRSTESLG